MSFPATLALEDGRCFHGRGVGARCEAVGEVVFNTGLTGYQEIFTDPSYSGQIVVLTAPHIGNYGTNRFDSESERPYIEGLVTREFSLAPSNWRSSQAADEFLSSCQIPILTDIDTRALVRHIRTQGALRGVVSALGTDPSELVVRARSAPPMAGLDLASGVSTPERYSWTEGPPKCLPSGLPVMPHADRFHVVAYDFGIKRNILRQLAGIGAHVTVLPCATSAETVLGLKPDGVFVSNGPGDPEPLGGPAAEIRKLVGRVPIFGICLGLQVLGQALGGRTYKLKFGHHGCNHPVLDSRTNKVEITSQNHGFALDPDSLDSSSIELTHKNLNDGTVEGFRSRRDPLFCVQYHPEAAPGPHDSNYLFDEFRRLMLDFA
ncbi:MAG: glutamine-hydrolyzing carbamoyl-phosphate synthase small subunit [Bryobacterales bacterium]|nr:glutamine-hydrolyzing carbamoyl-phosphate synthase small subunit [Bryobacterales bacterium]